jgi:oligopeptide transport system permease protein
LATLGICLPTFVLGPLLARVFGVELQWFNVAGYSSARDLVLPALTLGGYYAAYVARLTRAGMLDVLNQDFIRTARAKGASELRVLLVHGLRGGLLPLVAFLGPAVAGLITGSFVVETVFMIPGLGQFFVKSALNRDYFLICGTVLFYAWLIVVMNLIADVVQAWMDPRIRLEGGIR